MLFKCKLNIEHEVIVSADSKGEAENEVFATIADDIAVGNIPLDIYPPTPDSARQPMLVQVDVEPYK